MKTIVIQKPEQLPQEIYSLVNYFESQRFQIRLAGGAVRDILAEKEDVADYDFATTAKPDQMKLMNNTDWTVIPTGEDHGTMTFKHNATNSTYEVTTLRSDSEHDGRHAEVTFTDDWGEDALRRDFTINAMFLDVNTCEVFDYFNGVDDLKQNIVNFVGFPQNRIREDGLRIVRYFRFCVRYNFVPIKYAFRIIMNCISEENALGNVAIERVWQEIEKCAKHNPYDLKTFLMYLYMSGVFDHYNLMVPIDDHSVFEDEYVFMEHPILAVMQHAITNHRISVDKISGYCDRLKIPKDEKNLVMTLSKLHRKYCGDKHLTYAPYNYMLYEVYINKLDKEVVGLFIDNFLGDWNVQRVYYGTIANNQFYSEFEKDGNWISKEYNVTGKGLGRKIKELHTGFYVMRQRLDTTDEFLKLWTCGDMQEITTEFLAHMEQIENES